MNAIKDLLGSERGFLGLILLVSATVLTALGYMPVAQWQEFSLYVFGVYTAGKTVTGVVEIAKSAPSDPPPAAPPQVGETVASSTAADERRPRARKPRTAE